VSTISRIPFLGLALGAFALSFGKPLFVPLALALLLSFALAPLVSRIERIGLGRLASVLLVVALLGVLASSLAWIVGGQVSELSTKLPEYRRNLVSKARALRGPLGALARAGGVVEEIEQELETPPPGNREPEAPKVEVVQPKAPVQTAMSFLTPLLEPIGVAAAVAVMVIFLLLGREDLRDRLIRLAGGGDLALTTQALDDAASRLSRYLGMQSLICAVHGIAVGIGLAVIGVPAAPLWGILAGLLRFIPYIGPWIGAALPILISVAAFETWQPALLVIGLFVVLELVSNNVLEPWLYGSSAGLSSFAVILSAFFWTWLWGLPGLFLATPLTLCLVVAGRYVESFEFFRILLSDEAALDPDVRLYQRVLALDADESAKLIREALDRDGLERTSDGLMLPVLRWLARDLERGAVTRERGRRLREMLDDVVDELPAAAETVGPENRVRVLLVAGHDDPASLAAPWLGHVLAAHGIEATSSSLRKWARALAEGTGQARADAVVISSFTSEGAVHARRMGRRFLGHGAVSQVVVASWGASAVAAEGAGDHTRVSVVTRTPQLIDALRGKGVPGLRASSPPAEPHGATLEGSASPSSAARSAQR
jgi:predicted PurR-regulated permease PerM